jgi:hypothetical protein
MMNMNGSSNQNGQLPPPGPPGGGFRSFAADMKKDFPTLNEFTK